MAARPHTTEPAQECKLPLTETGNHRCVLNLQTYLYCIDRMQGGMQGRYVMLQGEWHMKLLQGGLQRGGAHALPPPGVVGESFRPTHTASAGGVPLQG